MAGSCSSNVVGPRRGKLISAVPFGVVLVLGVIVSCWLGASGFPCPHVDDGAYKSPAAEWIQHGRMTIPCLKGFFPRAETVFACLPPIYQWLLAAWYLVFGFSLYSTLAFHYTVHLLGTLAVMLAARRLMETSNPSSATTRNVIIASVGVIYLANLLYFDRPEETALLWVWLEVLVAQGRSTRKGIPASLASGVFVGLAALTSPAVGVLGAMIVLFRAMCTAAGAEGPQRRAAWRRAALQVAAAATVAAGMAAAWWTVMDVFYPGALHDQLIGTLGIMRERQLSGTLSEKLVIFSKVLLRKNPYQLPVTLFVLLFFPRLVMSTGWRRAAPMSLALYATAALGIIAVAVIRPYAYTYLGACMMLLLPCFGSTIERYLQGSRLIGSAVLALCTGIAIVLVVKFVVLTYRLPGAERPRTVFGRLTEIVPPGDSVAVLGLHWYPFQGRNPWRDAYLTGILDSPEIARYRWVVLPAYEDPPRHIDEFELVEEVLTKQGYSFTYAYRVWRRRGP